MSNLKDTPIEHIEALVSEIAILQVAIEPDIDTDLGYRPSGYKDRLGNAYKHLVKNQDARLKNLSVLGNIQQGVIYSLSSSGTDTENGDSLKALVALVEATAPTPSRPAIIKLMPGTYDLGVDSLNLTTGNIHFVSSIPAHCELTDGVLWDDVFKAGTVLKSSSVAGSVLNISGVNNVFMNIHFLQTVERPSINFVNDTTGDRGVTLFSCCSFEATGTQILDIACAGNDRNDFCFRNCYLKKGIDILNGGAFWGSAIFGGVIQGGSGHHFRYSVVKVISWVMNDSTSAIIDNTYVEALGRTLTFGATSDGLAILRNSKFKCTSFSWANFTGLECTNCQFDLDGVFPFYGSWLTNCLFDSRQAGGSARFIEILDDYLNIQGCRINGNNATYAVGAAASKIGLVMTGNVISCNNSAIEGTIAYDGGNVIKGLWVDTQVLGDYTNRETTGWEGINSYSMSFNDVNRTLTIDIPTSPPATYYTHWQQGTEYRKTSPEYLQIPDEEGLFFIYYVDGALTYGKNLTAGQISVIIRTRVSVAYVYWNATDKQAEYVGREPHTRGMPQATHTYAHFSFGAQYLDGLGITNIIADGNGTLDAHAQFGVNSGTLYDEDVVHFPASIISTAGLKVYYLTGPEATPNLRSNGLSGFSVTNAAVGQRLAYNQLTGGNYQLTQVTNGWYVLCHVFSNNSLYDSERTFSFVGQEQYETVAAARDAAYTEINTLRIAGVVGPEMVPIASVIFRTGDTAPTNYTNGAKAIIVSTDTGDDFVDHRGSRFAGSGGTSSVPQNLTDLDDVSITSAMTGQVLAFNGAGWANALSLFELYARTHTTTITSNVAVASYVLGGTSYPNVQNGYVKNWEIFITAVSYNSSAAVILKSWEGKITLGVGSTGAAKFIEGQLPEVAGGTIDSDVTLAKPAVSFSGNSVYITFQHTSAAAKDVDIKWTCSIRETSQAANIGA